jgi:hypothetical protein
MFTSVNGLQVKNLHCRFTYVDTTVFGKFATNFYFD